MELRGLLNYKTGFQLTKLVMISVVVISFLAITIGFIVMSQEISAIRDSVVVIDRSGEVLKSDRVNARETRVFEYENHVRTFYNLWYAFDEGSYISNVEKALQLIGESGKDMLDMYLTQNLERNIKEKNLIFSVYIKDIQIDMTKNTISGYIEGEQYIKRNRGELKRNLVCTFTIYDVDRTRDNPHGCKVDNWKIINEEIIK